MPTVVEDHGDLTGTSDKTVLSAPAASKQRWCDSIVVYNADSPEHEFTLKKDIGAGATEIVLKKMKIQPGETGQLVDKSFGLDNTDEILEVVMTDAVVGTAPTYDTSAVETP